MKTRICSWIVLPLTLVGLCWFGIKFFQLPVARDTPTFKTFDNTEIPPVPPHHPALDSNGLIKPSPTSPRHMADDRKGNEFLPKGYFRPTNAVPVKL